METNKIIRIIVISVAIIVIGFLGYLIFIKKQVGKAPTGFFQPARELTEEEKLDILKKLSVSANKDLSDKEKKGILDSLSIPSNQDLAAEEKFKILESLTQ